MALAKSVVLKASCFLTTTAFLRTLVTKLGRLYLVEVLEDPCLDAFLDDVVLHHVGLRVRGNVLRHVVVVLVFQLELVL